MNCFVFSPSEIYFFTGTPALTSRGMKEAEFKLVADFLDQGIKIAADLHKKTSRVCYTVFTLYLY